jgi:hypothetical protein
MNERTAKRTRAATCIGCGLPLLGFQTKRFKDQYGDVYHSRSCYDHYEQEREALAIFDTLPESEQLHLLQSKRDREAREGEAELNAFVSQRGGWN